jgi:ribA/ribD-fused uncharacterized protein
MQKVNLNPEVLINFFDGTDYDFLSNFHPSPIEVAGKRFPTVEHAFQAFKMNNKENFKRVQNADSPSEAKMLGRTLPMRADWDNIKFDIMHDLVRAKFMQNPKLAEKLKATGKAKLVEGTLWNDRIWGIDIKTGIGKNWLGQILMEVRSELCQKE